MVADQMEVNIECGEVLCGCQVASSRGASACSGSQLPNLYSLAETVQRKVRIHLASALIREDGSSDWRFQVGHEPGS